MELETQLRLPYDGKYSTALPMQILITGGAGFAGACFVRKAVEAGFTVLALAASLDERESIEALGATAIEGDLGKPDTYRGVLDTVDAIVHLHHLDAAWGPSEEFDRINVQMLEELLIQAIEAGVAKLLHLSTAFVALDGYPLQGISEGYRPRRSPPGAFPRSMIKAERLASRYADRIQLLTYRPPLIWGPGMPLLEEFKDDIHKNGFPGYGDPNHSLSTLHVENLSEALLLGLRSDRSGIYFLTDGEAIPLVEFMKSVGEIAGIQRGFRFVKRRPALRLAGWLERIWRVFRLGGSPPLTRFRVFQLGTQFTLDDSLARKELGYQPVLTLEQGFAQLREAEHSATQTGGEPPSFSNSTSYSEES